MPGVECVATQEELQRAATHAFRNAFLIGAALALAALLSLIPLRRQGAR